MAIKRPDEYQHNNPVYSIADSDFVRGGARTQVTDLAALYALADRPDQLKERATMVYVSTEGKHYMLIDDAQIGVAGGWSVFGGSSQWIDDSNGIRYGLSPDGNVGIGGGSQAYARLHVNNGDLVVTTGNISIRNTDDSYLTAASGSGDAKGPNLTITAGDAAGLTTHDGGNLILRSGNAIVGGSGSTPGNVYIYGGTQGASPPSGTIYLGDGVSGSLAANVSATDIVYYDTTTGLLTYGPGGVGVNSGSGITIDVSDNINWGGEITADVNLTFGGFYDVNIGTAVSNVDNFYVYTVNGGVFHVGSSGSTILSTFSTTSSSQSTPDIEISVGSITNAGNVFPPGDLRLSAGTTTGSGGNGTIMFLSGTSKYNRARSTETDILYIDSSGRISVGPTSGLPGTSYWSPSVNDIYNNNAGNVGIGTASPQNPLHVKGTAKIEAGDIDGTLADVLYIAATGYPTSYLHKIQTSHSSSIASNKLVVSLCNGTSGGYTDAVTILGTGNVGIGTTTPASKLDVTGTIRYGQDAYKGGVETKTYSVSASVTQELTYNNLSLNVAQAYRVRLATAATGSITGYTAIVYTADGTNWIIREVSHNGLTSNQPRLILDGNVVKVNTQHANPYTVVAEVESVPGGTGDYPTILGADSIWQRATTTAYYLDGHVGIGTTTPDYPLEVIGSASFGVGPVNGNTSKVYINNVNGKRWALSSGINGVAEAWFGLYNWTDDQTTTKISIKDTGQIGVGTNFPSAQFHLNTALTVPMQIDYNSSVRMKFEVVSSAGLITIWDSTPALKVNLKSAGDSYFNGGSLGIGTASPNSNGGTSAQVVHIHKAVAGGWAVNHYTNSDTGTAGGDGCITGMIGTIAYIFSYESDAMYFGTSGTVSMVLGSTGNLGVGIIGATARLHVSIEASGIAKFQRSSNVYGFEIGPTSGFGLYDYTRSVFGWYMNGGGDMGLGTTSASYRLQVEDNVAGYVGYFRNAGNVYDRGGIYIRGGGATPVANDCILIYFADGSSNQAGAIYYDSGGLFLYNAISSASVKEQLTDLDINGCEILNLLKPRKWKSVYDTYEGEDTREWYSGYVIEEIEPIVPHAVKQLGERGEKGYSVVHLIPILHKAILELQAEIELLKNP